MPVSYDDEKIKRPNVKHKWTKEMVIEYAKCINSVEYFISRYCDIVPDAEIIKSICSSERLIHLTENRREVVFYSLWNCLFKDRREVLLLSSTYKKSLQLMELIKSTYESIPSFLKKGVEGYYKDNIQFEEGNSISSRKIGREVVRGWNPSLMVLSDQEGVGSELLETFWESICPIVVCGGRMFSMTGHCPPRFKDVSEVINAS